MSAPNEQREIVLACRSLPSFAHAQLVEGLSIGNDHGTVYRPRLVSHEQPYCSGLIVQFPIIVEHCGGVNIG